MPVQHRSYPKSVSPELAELFEAADVSVEWAPDGSISTMTVAVPEARTKGDVDDVKDPTPDPTPKPDPVPDPKPDPVKDPPTPTKDAGDLVPPDPKQPDGSAKDDAAGVPAKDPNPTPVKDPTPTPKPKGARSTRKPNTKGK